MLRNNMRNILFCSWLYDRYFIYFVRYCCTLWLLHEAPNHYGVSDLHESDHVVTLDIVDLLYPEPTFLMKNHSLEIQYAADATPQPQPTYGTKRPTNFFAANFAIFLAGMSNNVLVVCPKPMQDT